MFAKSLATLFLDYNQFSTSSEVIFCIVYIADHYTDIDPIVDAMQLLHCAGYVADSSGWCFSCREEVSLRIGIDNGHLILPWPISLEPSFTASAFVSVHAAALFQYH